ncbi:MAG: hypothetical protein ABIJ34_07040 [archaeon]
MNPLVKKDTLNVLRATIAIIKKEELYKLRDLSDQVIHNATIFQDSTSITLAVVIYSISKLQDAKEVMPILLRHIASSITYLEKGKMNDYDKEIKGIIKEISEKDEKTKFYIQEVLERAQIKKASKMYEHGISLGQVAESLGISIWDLMEYVSQTRIVDSFEQKTDVKSKLELARSLFK